MSTEPKEIVLYFYSELSKKAKRYAYTQYICNPDHQTDDHDLSTFLQECKDGEYTFDHQGNLMI